MKNQLFLGVPSSFTTAYPQIKNLTFNGIQGNSLKNDKQEISYSERSIPQNIPCSNSRCNQGGYDLQGILIAITTSKMSSYEGKFSCCGHEGTHKDRVKGSPCLNRISFKIETTFIAL